MGDALSKPAEPWEDELPASPPQQQVPPAAAAAEQPIPSDRRRVKVSSARLKPADAAAGPPPAAAAAGTPAGDQPAPEPQQAAVAEEQGPAAPEAATAATPAAAVSKKRKAVEPADGDASESKRQQLLGLTILTLGVLQGLVPLALCGSQQPSDDGPEAAATEQQQQRQQPGPQEVGGAQGAPPAEKPAAEQLARPAEDAAELEAAAAAQPQPQQEGGADERLAGEAVQCTPPQEVPLSAAKPVSRSQLRQQLQLRSQRASGAQSPAVRAAGRVVGTPTAAGAAASAAVGGRSTRGQRLLGLVRQQQLLVPDMAVVQHAPAAESPQHVAQPFGAELTAGEGMDVEPPAGAAAAAADTQVPVGARQLAQRRLTQSPCRMAAPIAAGGSEAGMGVEAAGGECTPSRPPPAALSTPAIAEPGSAPCPSHPAAQAGFDGASPAGHPSDSPLQAASAREGDVEAALQQVGRLLVDLRGDSPQPSWHRHGTRAPEPAGPPEQEQARPEVTLQLDAEVQSRRQASPAAAAGQQDGAAQPPSPQEVSSRQRLQEEGADNFPGFWRPPAADGPGAAGEPAVVPRRRSSRKRANPVQFVADRQEQEQRQQRRRQQQGGQAGQAGQQLEGGSEEGTPLRGRERRVRFWVPGEQEEQEEQEAQPTPAAAPAAQHPAPLMVAPPVLPSGRAGGGAGRPSTPAKPAPLRMPQPPAFARFGAAAFHRPYAGPQGRRQALMSFVSDGGANCFALPPVLPADGEGGEGPPGPASDTTASPSAAAGGEVSGLVIPRRLQHRQGLGRRLSLQPDAPSLQGPELLAQEVREAFLNARLASHAGEAWARLDVAGCELRPGSAHAEALAELSSKLEAASGAEAVSQLLSQLDAEWQHLKRLRQKYVGGPGAGAAASPSPPRTQAAAPSPEAAPAAGAATDEAARPRGILKHKSSLSSGGQVSAAAAAAAAAVKAVAAEEQAVQAAPAAEEQAVHAALAAEDAPLAAAGFDAILAADIVSEAAPVEVAAPAACAPPAAPAAQPPTAQPPTAQLQVPEQQAQQREVGPDAMEVDAAPPALPGPDAPQPTAAATAEAATAPTVETRAPVPAPAAAAAPTSVVADDPVAQASAAPVCEAGQEQEPLSPRPVELTPGPSLSRGQKMLARLGTPLATGKLQLLASTDVGRKVAGASPLFAARPSGGSTAAPPRRAGGRMSRGERLLAVAKGGGGAAAPATASPAPAGQAGEGTAEEGPTLARAAAVLL